ncbi:hypothetical protein ACN47E_007252 [Coniothyrium glycines]
MLLVECEGTPYQIGHHHGLAASSQVSHSIAFYTSLFLANCRQTWPQVLEHAAVFERNIRAKWPAYHEEMRGIADGSRRQLLEIVALNVRTEIAFGLFSDGCTSLAWHTRERGWLGQNWDWMTAQKPALILLKITKSHTPTLVQVTEAGILGKIGFNDHGVGTCFNAIRVRGMDPSRLPAHLGLRVVLESTSAADAVRKLEQHGMASAAHILVADAHAAVGCEFTQATFEKCVPDAAGRVVHANHFLLEHAGQRDTVWLKDSLQRVPTMLANVGKLEEDAGWEEVSRLFEDETNFPAAICRAETAETGSATLFNVVMDLKARKAVVRLGRPTEVEERIELEL